MSRNFPSNRVIQVEKQQKAWILPISYAHVTHILRSHRRMVFRTPKRQSNDAFSPLKVVCNIQLFFQQGYFSILVNTITSCGFGFFSYIGSHFVMLRILVLRFLFNVSFWNYFCFQKIGNNALFYNCHYLKKSGQTLPCFALIYWRKSGHLFFLRIFAFSYEAEELW